MANLIPGVPRKNGGERRFAQRLVETLEDDYWAWHDVAVGRLQRRPDFVVLHPRRGLLVLEVKDWKIGTIHDFNKSSTTLLTDRGLVEAANPIRQARGILEYLCDMLERDPALVNPPGHSHAGKLAMPRGHGVVLANISRATFVGHGLDTIWPENLVICQDEMAEGVDAEAFQERLWNMFNYQFREPLTLPQIDRIRWHLYPEMRVHAPLQADLLSPPDSDPGTLPIPDIVRVMDRQQEQLARSLGDGHRIIHGVAGSGKTMILAYRCVHLARSLDRPILVLCFNRTLAARLAHAVDIQGLHSRVDVRSFHVWCA
ncbi:nuclease-related domain-containing DEAD/DEAH box helicase [Tahibacter soli]|uniref:NERD domain-containing protein n=1 Tax=Tahibacter soli TaxID=2983605 RepID=A0A9X4BHP0_9GAMM|nr:nuclease-related domain-containing DEAD/DEAH box helicase [Tahibacter soli]MDC8012628.1 NERD domain-containing protein [Tahibacter soli]